MENVVVEWQLASWAENVLVVCLGIAVASLFVWLVINSIIEAADREIRLEELRREQTTEALDKWMATFREEHMKRVLAERRAKQEKQLREQIAKGAGHES